jgi:hypothetical protein
MAQISRNSMMYNAMSRAFLCRDFAFSFFMLKDIRAEIAYKSTSTFK